MCLECSGLHRRLGVHISFCRSTSMDKWTYRQLYRCAVGGNARAREHWKRSGVDPHQKIDAKYSSMTAAQYKTSLEKDVADLRIARGGEATDTIGVGCDAHAAPSAARHDPTKYALDRRGRSVRGAARGCQQAEHRATTEHRRSLRQ